MDHRVGVCAVEKSKNMRIRWPRLSEEIASRSSFLKKKIFFKKIHISGCRPLTFFLCISEGVFYCPCCSLTTEYPAFLLHPFCCRTKSGKPHEQIQARINAVPCISRDSDGMAHPYRRRGQAGAIMVLLFWCGPEQPGANHGEVEFL